MAHPAYEKGVIDCATPSEPRSLTGKGVIITGGANGMGEEGVRAFVAAGALATFGDLDEQTGLKLEAEPNATSVRCNVTSWNDQLAMFKLSISKFPRQSIDIVVANAGISGLTMCLISKLPDAKEPVKSQLKIVNVDLLGVLYTLKLARHYFMKHHLDDSHDRCFIVNASLVDILEVPGIPQYMASKMNLTGPWYVGTTILNPTVQEYCKSKGIIFAEDADATGAWLKIASSPSINGRSFGIVPRDAAALQGYIDLGKDDYDDGEYLNGLQDILLKTSHRLAVKAENQ